MDKTAGSKFLTPLWRRGGKRMGRGRARQRLAVCEALEPRQVLAITGLPAAGDQFGVPLVLSTNGLGPNALSIVLDDVTTSGFVTATINGSSNRYWNFGNQISFTGTFDTDGTVTNVVTIATPFGVDVVNGANKFAWNTIADFTPASLSDVAIKLVDADELAIRTTLGSVGGPSSIAGTFHSPTLAPPPGALIDIQSTGTVTVLAAGVETYGLTLTSEANGVPSGIVFQGPVGVNGALTVNSRSDVSIDQPLTGKLASSTITVGSTGGAVAVNQPVVSGGAVSMTAATGITVDAGVASLAAGITLNSSTFLTVNKDITATNGNVQLSGVNGVTTIAGADVTAIAGKIEITSTAGFADVAGDLSAWTGIDINAQTYVTLDGATTINGTGNLSVTATAGNVSIQPVSPIAVTDGTLDLKAVAGTIAVASKLTASQAITLDAAQGIVLSNAVDVDAEVRATGPSGSVTLTSAANRIEIDAPVESQASFVKVAAGLGDVLIVDDVSALNDVTITANTDVKIDGVAPGLVTLTTSTGVIDVTSTTARVTLGPDLTVVAGPGNAAGVKLTAGTVVDVDVPLATQGAITIASPDGYTVKHAFASALGGIAITSSKGIVTSVVAPLTADGEISLTGQSGVTVDDTITSTSAGITLTSVSGTVSTAAATVLAAPSLTAGNIAVTAGTFSMGNDITAGKSITVTVTTSFFAAGDPQQDFTANAGDITIDVTGGNLDVSKSTLTAPLGSITLSAAGTVDYGALTTGPTGSVSITGGGVVTPVGPITAGGSITVSTGGSFLPTATDDLFAATGSITITATGPVDVSAIDVQAPLGSISLTSKTADVTVGAAPPNLFAVDLTTGKITLTATDGAVVVDQPLTAGSDITIAALDPFVANHALTSNFGNVSITSTGGGVTVHAAIVAGPASGVISIDGQGGTVTVNSPLTAGGDIDVTGLNNVEVTSALTSFTAGLAIASTAGSVDVDAATLVAPLGSISLAAPTGAVALKAAPLVAGVGLSVISSATLTVPAALTALTGNLTLASAAGDVAVQANLAAPQGTLDINAGLEINNGVAGGAVSATTVVAQTFNATASGVGNKFAFTNVGNDIETLSVNIGTGVMGGAGIRYVDTNSFSVTAASSATGVVDLLSRGGSITVNANIGAAPETLSGIQIEALASVTVNGTLSTLVGPGNIDIEGTEGGVTITGSVTAGSGTGGAVTITAGGIDGVTVTGAIASAGATSIDGFGNVTIAGAPFAVQAFAGNIDIESRQGNVVIDGVVLANTANVTVTAANIVNVSSGLTAAAPTGDVTVEAGTQLAVLGAVFAGSDVALRANNTLQIGPLSGDPVDITADTGSVTIGGLAAVASNGNINVNATIVANSGNITVDTLGALAFTGSSLTAKATASGLVRLRSRAATVTDAVVKAWRFEASTGVGNLSFTGANEVSSLYAITAGGIDFNNTIPLQITDFDVATHSVQVQAGRGVTITSPVGLRIVDGVLSGTTPTNLSAALAARGVEFVTTAAGDNPSTSLAPFAGTLRDTVAMVNRNAQTTMSLVFDETGGPGTVTLAAALPGIAKRVTVDGSLADGVTRVVLDGTAVTTAGANGLQLAAGSAGSTIQDMIVTKFAAGAGIEVLTGDNVIRNSRLSLNGTGIQVTGATATRNVIGVAVSGDKGNEIVGSVGAGIRIVSAANATSIYGNWIGELSDGTAQANGSDGIAISSTISTLIGSGLGDGRGNVISNNGRHGISLNEVRGTLVAYGSKILGNTISRNAQAGISLAGSNSSQVGAGDATAANVISRNNDGIRITGSSLTPTAVSNLVLGNAITLNERSGVRISSGANNRINGNVVTDNKVSGIHVLKSVAAKSQSSNIVINNEIKRNGSTANDGGIVLESSTGQGIGLTPQGLAVGNTVADNVGSGIVVLGAAAPNASQSNTVAGNSVSGNVFDGIRIQGALATTVSGNTATGNKQAGIAVVDAIASTAALGNVVIGNAVAGNAVGIRVAGGARTTIGGTKRALGNAVYSNTSHGIVIESAAGTGAATNIMVRNNTIGLDVANAAAGNGGVGIRITDAVTPQVDYGNVVRNNAGGGVEVVGGRGAMIGSTTAGQGNEISANTGDGVVVGDAAGVIRTQSVTVAANQLNDNLGWGIVVQGASTTAVTVGRLPSVSRPNGSENRIRVGTGTGGVNIRGGVAVPVVGNEITGGPLASAIVWSTPAPVAAPVITSAVQRMPSTRTPQYDIRGQMTGTAGQRFYVDLYATRFINESEPWVPADRYADDEVTQMTYIGRVLVTIGSSGTGTFRTIVTGPSGGAKYITATATNASSMTNPTSAFSLARATS